jgi:hypothetical protein
MILPLDLDGFVNLVPIKLEYKGPETLMQEKKSIKSKSLEATDRMFERKLDNKKFSVVVIL